MIFIWLASLASNLLVTVSILELWAKWVKIAFTYWSCRDGLLWWSS